jgi:hypothetical protein
MTTRVTITLSDPWDLVTACGTGPFAGTVLDVVSTRVLVEFDLPLKYLGQAFELALCQVRHTGTTIADLLSTYDVPTGIGLLVRSKLPPQPGVVTAQAKKGVAALGTIRTVT